LSAERHNGEQNNGGGSSAKASKRVPLLLALAGPSGSGKTRLAEELARELEGTHFHLDHYYRDLSHLCFEERLLQNFDHPDLIEHELLLAHLRELAAGRGIDRPSYDFSQHTRVPGKTQRVDEPHVLLIDGIFALHWPAIRNLAGLRIFVDTPDAICYERRLRRDVRERGRVAEQVRQHYEETVRPMAERFVRPSARWADLIVDGTSSLDWSVEQVLSALQASSLVPGNSEEEEPLGFA
jgi:uridine kinase